MNAELKMTKTDEAALKKLPKGWFEWFDAYGLRCPEFRIRRLVDRGKVEQKITGKWPHIEVRYRVKAAE